MYLNGEPVAMQLYGDDAGWYYFVNDHLGTPQKVVDDSGSVVWEAGYLPFGEARLLVADIENNLRFPGQYYDAETGLHYNWHRYYDPESGRYWTADPIGLSGGINLFAYSSSNPINYFDPLGLSALANPFAPSPSKKFEALMASGEYKQALEWARIMGLGARAIAAAQNAMDSEDDGGEVCEDDETSNIPPSVDEISEAAGEADRNRFTKSGRQLQKHANRPGSKWHQPDINANRPQEANPRGQELVDDVLTTPGSEVVPNPREGWDVISPDGRIIRINRDRSLQGFREDYE